MTYWLTETEESLSKDGYLDDLGLCEHCGAHHIYHVNPKGLQALWLLLFCYSRETGSATDEVEEIVDERISPQIEALPVPDEVKSQLKEQALEFLSSLEQENFLSACDGILDTILDFLPPLEPRH